MTTTLRNAAHFSNTNHHERLTWNPEDHPRWPAGSSTGGEFRPRGLFGLSSATLTRSAPNSYTENDYSYLLQEIDFSKGRHGKAVDALAEHLKRKGLIPVKEIAISGFGINFWLRGRADVLAYDPEEQTWSAFEVKTGKNPRLTARQAAYLPLLEIGWHLRSNDPRISELNIEPGQRFPPMIAAIVWQKPRRKNLQLFFLHPLEGSE